MCRCCRACGYDINLHLHLCQRNQGRPSTQIWFSMTQARKWFEGHFVIKEAQGLSVHWCTAFHWICILGAFRIYVIYRIIYSIIPDVIYCLIVLTWGNKFGLNLYCSLKQGGSAYPLVCEDPYTIIINVNQSREFYVPEKVCTLDFSAQWTWMGNSMGSIRALPDSMVYLII